MLPPFVCSEYTIEHAKISPIHSGLINQSYHVQKTDNTSVIVQRLHPTLPSNVTDIVRQVTEHLISLNQIAPQVILTKQGQQTLQDEQGYLWRALTYIEGHTVNTVTHNQQAYQAGAITAMFHQAVSSLIEHTIPQTAGIHNTHKHQRTLEQLSHASNTHDDTKTTGQSILKAFHQANIDAITEDMPSRIIHGDLKISNIRFATPPNHEAICLLDLDTIKQFVVPYELGDALRSWCNPKGEESSDACIDLDFFTQALSGYATYSKGLLCHREISMIVEGLFTVTLELAARFCIDAEGSYFHWDNTRFPSRRSHNLTRAQSQLALATHIHANRSDLEKIVHTIFV